LRANGDSFMCLSSSLAVRMTTPATFKVDQGATVFIVCGAHPEGPRNRLDCAGQRELDQQARLGIRRRRSQPDVSGCAGRSASDGQRERIWALRRQATLTPVMRARTSAEVHFAAPGGRRSAARPFWRLTRQGRGSGKLDPIPPMLGPARGQGGAERPSRSPGWDQ
jgi:hypothetical protein